MDSITEQEEHDASRRSLMKKAVVAGAVVWTAPVVMSAPAAFAQGSVAPTTPQETTPPSDTNLAPSGEASMSSVYDSPCNSASLGNDGLSTQANAANGGDSYQNWNYTDTCQNSIFHTNSGPGEWWQVDLGATKTITKIVLYNRVDGPWATRAQNIHLVVDGNDLGVIPGTTGSWSSVTLTGAPLPVSGHSVRVVNGADDYFHLAEVEVWGH